MLVPSYTPLLRTYLILLVCFRNHQNLPRSRGSLQGVSTLCQQFLYYILHQLMSRGRSTLNKLTSRYVKANYSFATITSVVVSESCELRKLWQHALCASSKPSSLAIINNVPPFLIRNGANFALKCPASAEHRPVIIFCIVLFPFSWNLATSSVC